MACQDDLGKIVRIAHNNQVIRETWFYPESWISSWIDDEYLRVAEVAGDIPGFMYFTKGDPSKINNIAVHPKWRGQGIGCKLIESVNEPVVAWVLEDSVGFWEKCGFENTGRVKSKKRRSIYMVKLGSQARMEDYYEGDKA